MPTATTTLPPETIRRHVRERYGAIAEQSDSTCGCGPAAGCYGAPTARWTAGDVDASPPGDSYGEKLGYTAGDLAAAAAADLGLGCGNPLAIASIQPGETVLDLGSGAGFDCLLAARQLAGTGRVLGVDMTASMVATARAIAATAGYGHPPNPGQTEIEYRVGEIEALPVESGTVDLIISNCVINLSPEKTRVFREAFRVLRPGGRLAIADVVATRPLPAAMREKLATIGACVGGATPVDDLRGMLAAAGFSRVEITLREETRALIREWTDDASAGDFVVSALVTAYKDRA